MNLWLFYPLDKLLTFIRVTGLSCGCHGLRLGPIVFLVVWKRKPQELP
jgi:hypothetical protein